MWNPKALKKLKTAPISMDRLDLEAAFEGAAMRAMQGMVNDRAPKGRRIVKNQSKSTRGGAIAGNKIVKNLEKDHVDKCREYGYSPRKEET